MAKTGAERAREFRKRREEKIARMEHALNKALVRLTMGVTPEELRKILKEGLQ